MATLREAEILRAPLSPPRDGRKRLMKRTFDILASLALVVVASPFLIAAALAVKVTSRGPVLFGHGRCGRGGRRFECLKFRTMVVDAEDWLDRDPKLRAAHREHGFKLPLHIDPRVTRLGRFLRFTHLDELPQLLNVLKGDMSLVGPRPIVDEELEWYGRRSSELLSVRPGVFGPWTAQGKRRVGYPERVDVELSYVENGTFLGDCKILVRHLPILLSGQREEEAEVPNRRPRRTARVA